MKPLSVQLLEIEFLLSLLFSLSGVDTAFYDYACVKIAVESQPPRHFALV